MFQTRFTKSATAKTVAALASGVLLFSTPHLLNASDHIDSPTVAQDRGSDIADMWAFLDPNDNSKLVLLLSTQGFIVSGEHFGMVIFDHNIRYRFEIENTGDAKPDAFIDVTYSPGVGRLHTQIATISLPNGRSFTAPTTLSTQEPQPTPAPAPVVTTDSASGVSFFAGVADDPFFLDDTGANRFVASSLMNPGHPNTSLLGERGGRDTYAGFNTLITALEVPVDMLRGPGKTIGINGLTQRRQLQYVDGGHVEGSGPYVNVDRQGNPLVNNGLIPATRKDEYNGASTADDAAGRFLASLTQGLQNFGTDAPHRALILGLVQKNGDILRVDPTVPNRGPGGGINVNGGFPNPRNGFAAGGRRLQDDVVDMVFTAINNGITLTDHVDGNQVPFRDSFPFVHDPIQPFPQETKLMIRPVSSFIVPRAANHGAGHYRISSSMPSHERTLVWGLSIAFLLLFAVSRKQILAQSTFPAVAPTDSLRAADTPDAQRTIRFLQDRIRHDPEDFLSYNALAGAYLQRLRETGELQLFSSASHAAQRSLAIVPEIRNPGGLAALARTEIAGHEFANARDHALRLKQLSSGDEVYALLADSSLELGDYEVAQNAVEMMERIDVGSNDGTEIRRARLDFLMGRLPDSRKAMANAIVYLSDRPIPPPEAVAWCYWQLGETEFSVGEYEGAEKNYRRSLASFPGYFRALAGLARARAARGDIADAISKYKLAVNVYPDPTFVAALGDLYKLSGRDRDAKAQYDLVQYIARLSELNGVVYNRQLALFDADHDLSAAKAYADAEREYAIRRDIYGADALAWTALKAGKTQEAQSAIRQALRLGTQDARLFYHAGLIARAAGDRRAALQYLQSAEQLNPQFDPLQRIRMAAALIELRRKTA